MKKIAIITRRAGYNMGSSLQALAMSKFIQNEGYDATILDYDEYSRCLTWRVKPLINKATYILFKYCSLICKKTFPNKFRYLDIMFTQISKFKKFEKELMPISKNKYQDSNDFKKTLHKYDTYICGSDQIWNPAFFDPKFLFDFIEPKDNITTIAYAPSIGVTKREDLPEKEQTLIKKIDYISCREKEGSIVLSDIVGKYVPTTLDPTLMLDKTDWDKILTKKKIIDGEYILTYFLHLDKYFEKPTLALDFVNQLKEKTGLKIINIQMFNQDKFIIADEHLYDCNPCDFISLIANARYICTNSFHCCVFAFQYEKRFFVFERFSKEKEKHINQNPRIYTLLEMFDCQESLISNITLDFTCQYKVDYSKGLDTVQKLREKSRHYINNAINNIK